MTLRVAIAGCGRIAGGPGAEGRPILGTHAEACRSVPGVELVAAADPDARQRDAFGRAWHVTATFESVARMVDVVRPDIVIVASPPETHEAICIEAASRGVRGILCEKPLSGRADSARRIVDACASAGIPLVGNFSRRWDPSLRGALEKREAIGRVVAVHGTYVGALRGNGSHLVDLIRMFVPGPWHVEWSAMPVRPNGMGASSDPGSTAITAALKTADTRAIIQGLDATGYALFEATFTGTRGRLRVRESGNALYLDTMESSVEYPGYSLLSHVEQLPGRTMKGACKNALVELAAAVTERRAPATAPSEFVASLSLLDEIAFNADRRGARTHV